MEGEGGLFVFLTKLIDLCLFHQTIKILWFLQDGTFFLVPHVTFAMLNGLKREIKLGLVFIMTNSSPGLFMHQTLKSRGNTN